MLTLLLIAPSLTSMVIAVVILILVALLIQIAPIKDDRIKLILFIVAIVLALIVMLRF